jgi:hypothetical protein
MEIRRAVIMPNTEAAHEVAQELAELLDPRAVADLLTKNSSG